MLIDDFRLHETRFAHFSLEHFVSRPAPAVDLAHQRRNRNVPLDVECLQPQACNAILADAEMGYAYAATLAQGESFTTVELKINFLRAVRKATLTAEAKVVKAGSTLGYVECEVRDE